MATKKKEDKTGIKNRDLIRFKQGFEKLADVEASAAFSYKVIKNLRIVQKELDLFEEMIKPSEEYSKEYQPAVEELAKKYCKKDDNGNPIPRQAPNGAVMYDFDALEKVKFDGAIEKLEKQLKYKGIISDRKKQIEKYNDLMQEDCLVNFIYIKEQDLPSVISPQKLELIFELIQG